MDLADVDLDYSRKSLDLVTQEEVGVGILNNDIGARPVLGIQDGLKESKDPTVHVKQEAEDNHEPEDINGLTLNSSESDDLKIVSTTPTPPAASQPAQVAVATKRRRGRPPKIMADAGQQKHQCHVCLKEFNRKAHLQAHLAAHSGVKAHRCEPCGLSFVYERSLRKHTEKHHGRKSCSAESFAPVNGVEHNFNLNGEIGNSADENVSSEMSNKENNAGSHHAAKIKSPPLTSNDTETSEVLPSKRPLKYTTLISYRCDYCLKIFTEFSDLEKHMYFCEQAWEDGTVEKIENKHDATDMNSHLNSHIIDDDVVDDIDDDVNIDDDIRSQKHKPNSKKEKKSNSYTCPVCLKHFSTKVDFKSHYALHENVKPLKPEQQINQCNICFKIYTRKSHLVTHMMSHSGEKTYFCKLCGKSFLYERSLKKHEVVHQQNPARKKFQKERKLTFYKCDICFNSFTKLEDLQLHITSCSGKVDFKMTVEVRHDYPKCGSNPKELMKSEQVFYACKKCDESFETKSELKEHKSMVHAKKPNALDCNVCSAKFPDKVSLKSHVRASHTTSFMCDVCGKSFDLKKRLTQHMWTHSDNQRFKCQLCDRSFSRKKHLERHNLVHTGVKTEEEFNKCDTCEKSFTNLTCLFEHMSVCGGGGRVGFVCQVCGKTYANSRSLRRHRLKHTGQTFTCEVCGKSFGSNDYLKQHLLTHTGVKAFQCEVCWKSFYTKKLLRQHSFIHMARKPIPCHLCKRMFKYPITLTKHIRCVHMDKEGSFTCPVCRKVFDSDNLLDDHLLTHANQQIYDCNVCQKSFMCHSALLRHMAIHTGFAPTIYTCEVCDQSFRTAYQLKKHAAVHSAIQKKHQCGTCGKLFTTEGNLKQHTLTHLAIKPFKCSTCGADFYRKQSLKLHEKIHIGVKAHCCEVCPMKFLHKHELYRHNRTHLGIKPKKCEYCGRGFSTGSHLKRHLMTHTGDRPYRCQVCGEGFTENRALKKHRINAQHFVKTEEVLHHAGKEETVD